MFGVHKHSKGLWDIIRPTLVCQTAGTPSSFLIFWVPYFSTAFHFLLPSFSSPTPCALKIAEKIFEQCNNAVLLMVIFWEIYFVTKVTRKSPFLNWKNVCLRLMEKRCFQAAVFLRLWCMSAKTLAGHSKTNTRKKISKNVLLCFWW